MKLYKKEGNVTQILSFPNENAEKGDYLMVEDADAAKACCARCQTAGNSFRAKTSTHSKSPHT